MRAFVLTSVISLLAGWWLHTCLQHTLADSRALITPAAAKAPAPPDRRSESLSASAYADIPDSEIPALALAALNKCVADGTRWETQLTPLWIRWAQFAPEAALEHLESAGALLPSLNERGMIWRVKDQILAAWASRDSRGAAAWFRDRLIAAVNRSNAGGSNIEETDFPALMETLALRDFPAAFSLIPSLFDKRSGKENGSGYGKLWTPVFYAAAIEEANFPGFLQSVRGVSSEDIRGQLCADVMSHIMQTAGIVDRRELIAQLPIPDRWPDGILNPWANVAFYEVREASEPEKTADAYVAKVKTDDPGRGVVLEFIIEAWAARDPEAAGQWLMKWDGVPEAGLARNAYAGVASKTDAVTAFEWANEFCEPQARAGAAQRAYFQWLDRNPAEADEWLTNQVSLLRW